ncbi:hypothetical protein RGUI_2666 [Rhodovulum sp. P5]|nr:hypothetical protein RGUI_2666 [Rhodovulum sp. P5]
MEECPYLPSAGPSRVRFNGFASLHLSPCRAPRGRTKTRGRRGAVQGKALEGGGRARYARTRKRRPAP